MALSFGGFYLAVIFGMACADYRRGGNSGGANFHLVFPFLGWLFY